MKSLLYPMLTLALTACMPQKAVNNNSNELALLVGTYTNGTSKGIYTFAFDQETGISTPLDSMKLANPSYLTPSADGKFVYAVSETSDSTAAISALAFNKQTGALHLLNSQPTHGADPCYVATNGKEVLTANYSGGTMSVFPLHQDGTIGNISNSARGSATGPDTVRQATAHVHCTHFSPDGNYIFATDFSADRLLCFALTPQGISPHPTVPTTDIEPNSGPRHLTFGPNGKFAYLLSELSGKVTVFAYNNGILNQIQSIIADSIGARGSADIHVSPDGKHLYASNRLKKDGLAIFAIDPDKGTLTPVGYQLTGIHPRNFNITPNGKYLLVACRDSNTIQVYKRDEATGLLKETQQEIRIDKPVCIQFIARL